MNSDRFKQRTSPNIYDVVIVGAGVVGCALARRFTLEGASVLIIEKCTDILSGASKGNSALLHTGFDAPEESLELSCIKAGYKEYIEIRNKFQLPLLKTTALVVAWTKEQVQQLPNIVAKAHANGITNVRLVDSEELKNLEPNLSSKALGAVLVPDEYAIDPWSAPLAYLTQSIDNGAKLMLSTEISEGNFDGEVWHLETQAQKIKCRTVINCAGLYGDILDKNLLGEASFEIRPRKGQFVVFDKIASELMNAIILPVPTAITKGIVVCKTVFGNVLVGPTAEEQESRSDSSVNTETLAKLQQAAIEIIPELQGVDVTATYSGIRPATEEKDYRISFNQDKNWISVGGIRSTGLTAALGIASYVYKKYEGAGNHHKALSDPSYPIMPNLAEHKKRDYSAPGNDGIVCHCELVSKREIINALNSNVPAKSLEGLKRRTRVTMGRCQGFYCTGELSVITQGCFEQSIAVGKCHGK